MTPARQLRVRLAREMALIDSDRTVCGECSGSGYGDYGRCPDCDGIGSHPAETSHLQHDDERFAALDRAIAKQPHAFESAPRGDGTAPQTPAVPSFLPSKKVA